MFNNLKKYITLNEDVVYKRNIYIPHELIHKTKNGDETPLWIIRVSTLLLPISIIYVT